MDACLFVSSSLSPLTMDLKQSGPTVLLLLDGSDSQLGSCYFCYFLFYQRPQTTFPTAHDNKNVCTGEGEELPESHQLSNADGQDCLTTPAYPCSLLSHCGHLHAAETTEMTTWEASRKTCFHCKAEAGLIGVSHTEMGHLHPYILYALIQAADTIDTILTEVYWL